MTGRWKRLILAPAALACSLQAGAAERPNFVVITIDTLRADHLGCYDYFRNTSPEIDEFATETVFFEMALTPIATTLPAHLSLFTATYPLEHGLLANLGAMGKQVLPASSLLTFAEVVKARGYHTAGFVSAAPVQKGTGIEAGFVDFDGPPGRERKAMATNEAVLRWLERAPQPFFLWVHYFDPHAPYTPPRAYRERFHTDAKVEAYVAKRRIPDELERPVGGPGRPLDWIGAYDGEIGYTDFFVGQLLERLRERGLWQSTAIVLAADHGEGLGEHDMAGHGYIWREQLHVPLMLRVPGVKPRRVSYPVSLVDTLPTLLGLVGGDWSKFLDQSSGVDVLAEGFEPLAVFSQQTARDRNDLKGRAYALATARWKYMSQTARPDRLFDWIADPLELDSVIDEHKGVARELKGRLNAMVQLYEKRGDAFAGDSPNERSMDPELLEKLRALGYVD